MTQEKKKSGGCLRTIGLAVVVIVGLFVALVVVVAIFGPSSSTASRPAASNASTQANAAPDATSTPLPVVGQDVTVDQVRWKMISAENLGNVLKSGNQFTKDKKTSGVFVKVRFEMENLSNDMLSFGGLEMVDDQDRKFTSASDVFMFIENEDERCVFENLNPNITKTCTTLYEVPANAKGLKAIVSDLKAFGAEEALVELGL